MQLLHAGVPVSETWNAPAEPIDHAVGFSNAAMRALVNHLYERGYRRIGSVVT